MERDRRDERNARQEALNHQTTTHLQLFAVGARSGSGIPHSTPICMSMIRTHGRYGIIRTRRIRFVFACMVRTGGPETKHTGKKMKARSINAGRRIPQPGSEKGPVQIWHQRQPAETPERRRESASQFRNPVMVPQESIAVR